MIRNLLANVVVPILFVFCGSLLNAQVVINEIMSSNSVSKIDDFGDYSDWIELYNAGNTDVDLTGWGLSDDISKYGKWKFPSFTLKAGGYQLVWASNQDTSIASTTVPTVNHFETLLNNQSWKYINPSADISNWKTVGFNDASWTNVNCPVGYGGGTPALATTVNLTNPAAIYLRKSFNVADKSQIKELYFYMAFDDGFIAYLNGVEVARKYVSGSPDYNDYTDDAQNEPNHLEFSIDGASLVNGTNVLAIEVRNANSTSSDILADPYLIAGIGSPSTLYTLTKPSFFTKTVSSTYSFHTSFTLSSSGETVILTNALGQVQNVLPAQSLSPDHSWGRSTNGGVDNVVFTKSSPGLSNTTGTSISGYTTGVINASLAAGFYSGTQTLTLSFVSGTGSGETIRYTTDGSKPTSSSQSYSSSISISSSRTIRAASFASGKIPAYDQYLTNTYVIGSKPSMPVVFISGNPSDIEPSPNSSPTSMYAEGPGAGTCGYSDPPYECYNYYQDWDKEVHVEYLTVESGSGNQRFEVDAAASIFGGWSRISVMKSMAIKTGAQYNSKDGINYQIFPNKPATHYNAFSLRNAGNDFQGTMLRDAINHMMIQESVSKAHWNIDYEDYFPVIVYMNGKYFGIHQMRERTDDSYIENNHGVDKYDMVESKGETNGKMHVREGSDASWIASRDYVLNTDLTNQSNFDNVSANHFDTKNVADYFALETFSGNWDWPHNNVRVWKPRTGGQWRYIVHDMDFAFDLQSVWGISTVENNELKRIINKEARDWNTTSYKPSQHIDILNKLLTNAEFKRYFINRYADLLNTALGTTNTLATWDKLVADLDPEISAMASKWSSSTGLSNTPQSTATFAQGNGKTGWNSYCSTVRSKISSRTSKVRDNIQDVFSNVTAQQNTTLQSSPSAGGLTKVNTITPTKLPWTGVYFTGNAITLTAMPNSGYVFTGWTITGASITSGSTSSATISVNVTATSTITANYSSTSNIPKVIVNEINYNSATDFSSGDWIELFNAGNATQDISGWIVRDNSNYKGYEIPQGTSLGAGQYIVIAKDLVDFMKINPSVTNVIGEMTLGLSSTGDRVRLFDAADRLVADFSYDVTSPWPTSANGLGATLDLVSSSNNPAQGASWRAGCENGTPGKAYATYTPSLIVKADTNAICSGDSTKIRITTRNIGTTSAIQWKKNSINISGATSKSYEVKTGSLNDKYILVAALTDVCASPKTATSNEVIVSVNPSVLPTVSLSSNLTSICQGTNLSFTSTFTNAGTTPSFKWLKNNTVITSATQSTYQTSTAVNNDSYVLQLTSSLGCVTQRVVNSNSIPINVTPKLTPKITIVSKDGETVNQWNYPEFTATVTNGGTSPTISWYLNNNLISTASGLKYTSSPLENEDEIYAVVNSNASCLTSSTANSNVLSFSIITDIQDDFGNTKLQVYPNPSTDFVKVEVLNLRSIILYNTLGEVVLKTSSSIFDMSTFAVGVYVVEILTENNHFKTKVEKR